MAVQLEKYTSLYDFAPIGYFSLDDQGEILEANRKGAAVLRVGRSQLLGHRTVATVEALDELVWLLNLASPVPGTGPP